MFQIEKYCQMFELFCHLKTMLKTILRPEAQHLHFFQFIFGQYEKDENKQKRPDVPI